MIGAQPPKGTSKFTRSAQNEVEHVGAHDARTVSERQTFSPAKQDHAVVFEQRSPRLGSWVPLACKVSSLDESGRIQSGNWAQPATGRYSFSVIFNAIQTTLGTSASKAYWPVRWTCDRILLTTDSVPSTARNPIRWCFPKSASYSIRPLRANPASTARPQCWHSHLPAH